MLWFRHNYVPTLLGVLSCALALWIHWSIAFLVVPTVMAWLWMHFRVGIMSEELKRKKLRGIEELRDFYTKGRLVYVAFVIAANEDEYLEAVRFFKGWLASATFQVKDEFSTEDAEAFEELDSDYASQTVFPTFSQSAVRLQEKARLMQRVEVYRDRLVDLMYARAKTL